VPIRVRLALAAIIVTVLLVSVGGLLFVRSFRNGLVDSLDRGLTVQGTALAGQVRTGEIALGDEAGSVIPSSDEVAQVLSPSGEVLDTTVEAGRRAVIPRSVLREGRQQRVFTDITIADESEPFRVVARPARTADGERVVVVVGTSLEETEEAVDTVETAILRGGGIAVVLVGIGAWLLAGAALRPVERMRRGAASISGHDPEGRLEVPATRDEIAKLGTTMNELLERLQSALDRQRAFVADAGHELRSPLAVLRAELELASRPERTRDELQDAVRHGVVETDRLARLANELLFLARDDSTRVSAERRVGAVLPVLERSVDGFRVRAAERDITLDVDSDLDLRFRFDAELVRRAVDNLVDNALRYAPARSTVTVGAHQHDGVVDVAVLDEGPGFPEDFLPHAFERFRRADDARSRGSGGTGLGLSIVLAVADAHGGTATAVNRPGGGAVLTLRLPVGDERR